MNLPTSQFLVLCGGPSAEREVSLRSGRAVSLALARWGRVQRLELTGSRLPEGLDPRRDVIFPALHGTFGEDGRLQGLLDRRGFAYAGSGAVASRRCMDKQVTKDIVRKLGLPTPPGLAFRLPGPPPLEAFLDTLGEAILLKPRAEGSSIGLRIVKGAAALQQALSELSPGDWLAERHLQGHDLTVGVLDGQAMGVVEVLPQSGVFDYASKYTPGASEIRAPAQIDSATTRRVQEMAEAIFRACGCRDFARIDFYLTPDGPYFLEVNTLPGMTETSLLPRSAGVIGLNFSELVRRMVQPALHRFSAASAAA